MADPALAAGWLEALPEGVVVIGADGEIRYLNPPAAAFLAGSRDALAGRPFDEVAQLFDREGRGWWACTERLRAMRGVRGVPPRLLECRAGGRVRPVVLRAAFRRDAGGAFVEAVCLVGAPPPVPGSGIVDPELLAALAHDLRAPLTGIGGFGSTLLNRWDRFDDANRREIVGTIVAEAGRLGRMVRELVEAARVDALALPRRRAPVEVERLVHDGIARAGAGAPRDLEPSFIGEPGVVLGDGDRLAQALAEILEHAVAVSQAPGPIRIDVNGAAHDVLLLVRPTGPPLEPAIAATLFTLRGRRGAGGTGLGLFIAKGVVEAHGGRVALEPGPPGGTAIRLWLPRGPGEASPEGAGAPPAVSR